MLVLLRRASSGFTNLPSLLCLHFPSTPFMSSPSFLPWHLHLNYFNGVSLLPIPFDRVTLPPCLYLLPWHSRFPLLSFRHPATLHHRSHHPYLLLLSHILHAHLICHLCRNSSPFILGSHFVFLLRSLTRFCLSSSLSPPFSLILPWLPPNFIAPGSPTQSFPASSPSFNPT